MTEEQAERITVALEKIAESLESIDHSLTFHGDKEDVGIADSLAEDLSAVARAAGSIRE